MGFNLPPKRIVLGIDTFDLNQLIRVKRGFIGSLRVQAAFIGRDKKVFVIPEGTTAKVRMLKPDQKKVLNDTEQNGVVEGNTVTFKITDQMQAYPGEGALEIILFNGGETVTSSTCGIEIKPNVHDDSGLESTDEWLTVINTLAQIEEVVTNANQAIAQLNETIENAEEAAQAALNAAGDVTAAESYSKQSKSWAIGGEFTGDDTNNSQYYKEKAEEAKTAAEAAQAAAEQARNEAEEIVGIGVASETEMGLVKGGGNVNIAADGMMDVDLSEKLDTTGDSKDNIVTYTESETDTDIASGDTHATLFGKLSKRLHVIKDTLLSKLNIGDDYRPNILKNPDFRINSRGQASYNVANELTVDKWVNHGASTVITPLSGGGINISCTYTNDSNLIMQTVDDYIKYKGRTVTLTVKYKNFTLGSNTKVYIRIGDGVGTAVSELNNLSAVSGLCTITRTLDTSLTQLIVNLTKYGTGSAFSIDIEWTKLEINDHATPFIPKTDNEELLNISDSIGYTPNLLINGDFNINQRGLTTYNGVANTAVYTVDRWRMNIYGGNTLIVNTNKTITVQKAIGAQYFWLDQPIEKYNIFNNKVVTLSAKIDGHVIHGTSDIILGNTSRTFCTVYLIDGGGNNVIDIFWDGSYQFLVRVIITDTETHNIEWIKLELNDHPTLFIPRGYGEELALCQRYYEASDGWISSTSPDGTVVAGVLFKARKRITPNLTIRSQYNTLNNVNLWSGADIPVTNVIGTTDAIQYMHVTGGIKGERYVYSYVADAEI